MILLRFKRLMIGMMKKKMMLRMMMIKEKYCNLSFIYVLAIDLVKFKLLFIHLMMWPRFFHMCIATFSLCMPPH